MKIRRRDGGMLWRHSNDRCATNNFSEECMHCALEKANAEIKSLREGKENNSSDAFEKTLATYETKLTVLSIWKTEAIKIIGNWEQVFRAIGPIATKDLGKEKHFLVLEYLRNNKGIIESLAMANQQLAEHISQLISGVQQNENANS